MLSNQALATGTELFAEPLLRNPHVPWPGEKTGIPASVLGIPSAM
jgi:hypothetical protein